MMKLSSAVSSAALALALSAAVIPTARAADSTTNDPCSPGRSGSLRACVADTGDSLPWPAKVSDRASLRWVPLNGVGQPVPVQRGERLRTPDDVGIWKLEQSEDGSKWTALGLELVTRAHYDGRRKDLNGYLIGKHPGVGRKGKYTPPERFIEVTKENQDYALSENFKLRQFLTKNQHDVWPKYLPLSPKLVDKLELIIQELRREGIPAQRVHVMSGYRTPHYNGPGGKGRAKFSRHTYGDAADIWVDDDNDGYMDDLNRDGKIDDGDSRFLVEMADRVERAHPDLVGGAGIYKANRVHGPFTHIDVRGSHARWTYR